METAETSTSPSSNVPDHVAWFWLFFAVAALFHCVLGGIYEVAFHDRWIIGPLVFLPGCLVILSPRQPRWWVLLVAAEWVEILWFLPSIPNHWLLTGMVGLSALTSWLWAWHRGQRLWQTFGGFTVVVRLQTVLFYAFTAFWKLNTDFFEPTHSCATVFFGHVRFFLGLPEMPVVEALLAPATLVVELALPVLLWLPRTRFLGVALGFGFHSVLLFDAHKGFINFSSIMFALLVLFLPAEQSGVRRWAKDILDSRRGVQCRQVVVALWLVVLGASIMVPVRTFPLYFAARHALGLAYGFVMCLALCRYVLLARDTLVGDVLAWPQWRGLQWVLPALIVCNGIMPILGLKTRSCWQMYSNVYLDAETSNHWLIPRSLDLAGQLREPIFPTESDARMLSYFAQKGFGMTRYDLERAAREHPNARLSYRVGEKVVTHARLGDVAELQTEHPLWMRKLFWFAPLGPKAAEACVW